MGLKTVILAGGYGTRIRDVSSDIPKPMIPIGHYPVLWHVMKHYACFGIKEFVLCLGYKSEVIKDYFSNYLARQNDFSLNLATEQIQYHTNHRSEDWTITFSETGLNTQTGGRVFKIKKYLEKEQRFMLTYGDGVGDIDIDRLLKFHQSHGKLMTVTAARPPGRFGELEIEGDQVIGFNEKPQTTEGWISAGYFVCEKEVWDYLNSDENLILERDPINNLVKDHQLMVYKHFGFWHPMDTSRDYHLLNQLWSDKQAPWKLYT